MRARTNTSHPRLLEGLLAFMFFLPELPWVLAGYPAFAFIVGFLALSGALPFAALLLNSFMRLSGFLSQQSCARTSKAMCATGHPELRLTHLHTSERHVDMRKRLMICSVVVAVVGLLGALLIYVTAGDDADSDENVQTVIVAGKAYKIPLDSTKIYRRDLQRAGGDLMVAFDDLIRWFAGLWRGRSLAITVAWITAFVSLGLFLAARNVGADQDSEDPPAARTGTPTTPQGSS